MPTPPLPAAAARAASNPRAARVADVFYPSSDGKPMAENMWQADVIMNGAGDLRAARPQALVAADILVYPEEGNSDNKIAPDVLVAFGLGTHKRSSYFVWVEGKPPDWVLEVASQSTKKRDLDFKRNYYAEMGVPEYWMFDPSGDVYPSGTPRLQGFKLVDGEYQPLESRLVDGKRTIRSEVLGLDVRVDDELLRFRDVATGRDIRHRAEADAAAEQAEAEAKQESAQRKSAEARAERESAQRKSAEAHAERESAQRKSAEARAEQESAQRKSAEARTKRESAQRRSAEARAKRESAQRRSAEAHAERESARARQEAAAHAAAEARVAELEDALRRSRHHHPP